MKLFLSICLIIIALIAGGCARISVLLAETPTPPPTGIPETATPFPTSTPYLPVSPTNAHPDCPATTLVAGTPPSKDAGQYGATFWYQSKDNQLWAASLRPLVYTGEDAFIWSKPAGSRLILSGQRIDGEAAPFHAILPASMTGDSLLTTLIFPSAGCWSVQAQAGASTLEMILYVEPYLGPQGGECATLDDAVRLADAILVAKATHRDPSKDYAWQTLQVQEVWKKPFLNDFPTTIAVLQNLSQEPELEAGKTYLLFLQYTPWMTVCGRATLAEISGPDVQLLSDQVPLWKGTTLSDVHTEIMNILEP